MCRRQNVIGAFPVFQLEELFSILVDLTAEQGAKPTSALSPLYWLEYRPDLFQRAGAENEDREAFEAPDGGYQRLNLGTLKHYWAIPKMDICLSMSFSSFSCMRSPKGRR